jgi:hypothetical protein
LTKRATIVAAIGLLAALVAVPSVAFAQDEGQGSSDQPPASGGPTESGTSSGETPATPPDPVTPDVSSASTEEEPESDVVETDVATSDDGSADTSSTATASTTQASTVTSESTITQRISKGKKAKASSRKGKKKACSASSRGGGSPLAQASAPVAAGCTRLNGPNGVFNAPDGTTLTVTETSEGVITVTVSGAPGGTYSGTLFVKGGPSDPGNPCVFNAVPNGASQTCTAPVNPNSGKLYGVSHVDACPPGVTPVTTPGGETGKRGGDKDEKQKRERRKRAAREGSPPVAAASVAAPGGQLPVTGLPLIGLVLVGAGLLASGFALKRVS